MIWSLRIADVVDIALVAFLLYIFFWWVRRQLSASALRGVGVVTVFVLALYLPARLFEMYMVEQISQLLIIFVLLAVIVIFQSDLRRLLYSAGTRLFGQDASSRSSDSSNVDVLVDAIAALAESSTGALIAIRGRDPWSHYIQGGVELNGSVSAPLLHSLFEPHTPGHDGAVLLEGSRVTSFAAHLPLSEQMPHESRYGGTRHAAALGLAEVCDALVAVVSEERGTISVARDGKIREVESTASLKEELRTFWSEYYERSPVQQREWWSRSALQTAVFSVGVSVLLWFVFAYSPETVYRSFDVPVEYHNVPSNWALEEGTTTAQVTLSGSKQAFRTVDRDQLAIAFSLEEPEEGTNELVVNENNLSLPSQLTLTSVVPRTIKVSMYRLQQTKLPVSVQTEGRVPDSLQLMQIETTPDSVTVLVPDGTSFPYIETEPVVLDSIRSDTTLERPLLRLDGVRFPDSPSTVDVRVVVRPPGDSTGDG